MAEKGEFAVRIIDKTLIRASDPPPSPRVLPVSNIDLILHSFPISLIAVYPARSPAAGDFSAAAAAVRSALPSFLNHLFPFAGRIVANPATSLPEIHCNNAGAELVLAEADAPLSAVDFGDVHRSLYRIQIPFGNDVALSLQLVRFACGGFSVSWGTNHLLVDGHGLTMLPTLFSELAHTGALSRSPNHDRSLFGPRSPPRYDPALDQEFTLYDPARLVNVLMCDTFVRRNYRVDAADVERLRAAASEGQGRRRATRLEAVSAYIWKALAAATAAAGGDERCRMAWLVDGRPRLAGCRKYAGRRIGEYLGNVITYAWREARVEEVAGGSMAWAAAEAGAAIAGAAGEERFQQLVDWMEGHKGAGKWTETVGLGLGSPAAVVSSFLPFRIDADFGFGPPALAMPWLRPGRLGSAAFTISRGTGGDGSWVINTRLWPSLAAVLEGDPAAVFKPLTADSLGLAARQASRL
ncbi:putrescine hydroxycinnamoyltransferase-like [Ananas comosus]|nr:putrescine hydroxycinnamoyltransferase-like [Ananas comosus]